MVPAGLSPPPQKEGNNFRRDEKEGEEEGEGEGEEEDNRDNDDDDDDACYVVPPLAGWFILILILIF